MADRVDITVAICTWNRAALLDQTLAALTTITPPPGKSWEVLVIDNNSPDRTPEVIAAHLAAGKLPLRSVRELKQGQSNARNRGLDDARGDWVVWTDDDVRPAPDWLTGFAATTARHPEAAAIGGPIHPWFPHPPDPDLVAVFQPLRIGYCGVNHGPIERELTATEPIYGANMAFRAAAVAGLRFDPEYGRKGVYQGGGDDTDYLRRVRSRGGAIWWSPTMSLEHYVEPSRMTVEYARRYIRDGAGHADPNIALDPSPRWRGVPRWLYRKVAWHWLKVIANLRPGCRRQRLTAMLELADAQARIRAFRRFHQRPVGA